MTSSITYYSSGMMTSSSMYSGSYGIDNSNNGEMYYYGSNVSLQQTA